MSCECQIPAGEGRAFCARHGVEKPSHWRTLCAQGGEYFRRWEDGVGPGQNASLPDPLECVYRGKQIDTKKCRTCPKSSETIQVAVYSCAVHGSCTLRRAGLDHVACVKCRDRPSVGWINGGKHHLPGAIASLDGDGGRDLKLSVEIFEDDRPDDRHRGNSHANGGQGNANKPRHEGTSAASIPSVRPNAIASITACITEFRRPESLKRLLASLNRYFPDLKVDVEPTGGNLCRARNALSQRCKTPYYFMLEEDFEATEKTDLLAMLKVLEAEPTFGGVTAITHEPKKAGTDGRGGDIWWHQDFRRIGNTLYFGPHHRPRRTVGGIDYIPCDVPLNFGLFRNQLFKDVPWDENLPVGEFGDFYWRVFLDARWTFGCIVGKPSMVTHHRDRPGSEYNQPRNRNLRPYLAKKWGGMTFITRGPKPHEQPVVPNVIILGQGHANTTITTKMASVAFGLNPGDADDEYAESVSVRAVNQQVRKTGELNAVDARRALRRLAEPWIVKDPRFTKTLPLWVPELERYQPLLVHVTKDQATVRESHRKRGELHIYDPQDVERCEAIYANWPWAKTRVSAEQIGLAIQRFDTKRMATPAVT